MPNQKSSDLFFPAPLKGIGDSPYVSNGRLQNLEIFQVPGIAKIKYQQSLFYPTLGLPIAIVKDPIGNVWAATNNNWLYKNGSLVFTGTYNGIGGIWDMKVVGNYIMITRFDGTNTYIDLISSSSLFANWGAGITSGATLNNLYNACIYVAPGNQFIYIGNGNNVANITLFTPNSNPLVAPTATLNPTAIPLQYNEFCRTLAVLGRNLLIGTQGGANFSDLSQTIANIYPYDLSTQTLGQPIAFEENGINQMFVYNNLAYIHAGIYGNIYTTNGSSVQFYKRVVPSNRAAGTTLFPHPNAINYINNKLLVGTSTGTDFLLNPSTSVQGIYEISGKILNFQTISTLNVGSTQTLAIGAILPIGNDNLYVGWQDGPTTFGVDHATGADGSGIYVPYTNFSAIYETEVEIVGEPEDNSNFNDIIVYLSQSLVVGQQIQLQYRDGFTNQWVNIPDYRTAGKTYLDVNSGASGDTALFTKSRINNVNSVQIQVALNQTAAAPQGSNIGFMGVKIKRNPGQ